MIDLRDGLSQEWNALKGCFRLTPGNSDTEKIGLWVALGLVTVLVLGVAFGFIDFDALPPTIQTLIEVGVAALLYFIGRTHGRELTLSERIERRVDELKK